MDRTAFTTLEVYQLAEGLADRVWGVARTWDPFACDTVGRQIVRSVDSIGANIAEGYGRGSYADNARFIKIARGSLNETIHHLRRAYQRGLLTEQQIEDLSPLARELAPRLNAYLGSISRRASSVKLPTTNHKQHATDKV